jgi:hypothetical protein
MIELDGKNDKENTNDAKCDYYYGIRNFEVKRIRKPAKK